MATFEITLKLPEELVRDAREFNLLTDQAIADIVRAEVDRRVEQLVNEEIQAHRTEKALHPRRQRPE